MTVQVVKAAAKKAGQKTASAASKTAATARGAAAAGRESRRAYQERYDARQAAARKSEPLLAPRTESARRRPAREPASEPLLGGGGGGGRRSRGGGGGRGRSISSALGSVGGRSRPMNALKAEFLLCMVILALSPLADRTGREGITDAFRRCAACMGLFFLLGLLAAGGPKQARTAAGFGGLVTVALMVAKRDVFGAVVGRITSKWTGPADTAPDGGALDDVAAQQVDAAASNDSVGDNSGGGTLGPGGTGVGGTGGGGLGLDGTGSAAWTRGPLPDPNDQPNFLGP